MDGEEVLQREGKAIDAVAIHCDMANREAPVRGASVTSGVRQGSSLILDAGTSTAGALGHSKAENNHQDKSRGRSTSRVNSGHTLAPVKERSKSRRRGDNPTGNREHVSDAGGKGVLDGPSQPRSWANVARAATKGYSLPHFSPLIDCEEELVISKEVIEHCNPKWKECLVGYFVGKKVPFKLTEAILRKTWGSHLVEVMANQDGFFMFHIPDGEVRRRILDGGHLVVARVPLILQQWHPLMDLKKGRHDTIPVWVKLRNLPFALWSPIGIGTVASRLGKPLYVDSRTEKNNMISFARVCIEINATKPFRSSIPIRLGDQSLEIAVEYEWRPAFCEACGVFGHKCRPVVSREQPPISATRDQPRPRAQETSEQLPQGGDRLDRSVPATEEQVQAEVFAGQLVHPALSEACPPTTPHLAVVQGLPSQVVQDMAQLPQHVQVPEQLDLQVCPSVAPAIVEAPSPQVQPIVQATQSHLCVRGSQVSIHIDEGCSAKHGSRALQHGQRPARPHANHFFFDALDEEGCDGLGEVGWEQGKSEKRKNKKKKKKAKKDKKGSSMIEQVATILGETSSPGDLHLSLEGVGDIDLSEEDSSGPDGEEDHGITSQPPPGRVTRSAIQTKHR